MLGQLKRLILGLECVFGVRDFFGSCLLGDLYVKDEQKVKAIEGLNELPMRNFATICVMPRPFTSFSAML